MGGERAAWRPGYRITILDGNHPAGAEHRIKELRTIGAGARPGHAPVVLDPRAMPVADVFPREDGRAQERSLRGSASETARAGQVWIADRNSGTAGFHFGIDRRGGHFVIRQPAATRHVEWMGRRRAGGRPEAGAVLGPRMRLGDGDGGTTSVRRVAAELDTPARGGETGVHIVTDLPAEVADALDIADPYRRRWTVGSAFGELATCLDGEVDTRGDPKAASFAFGVALVSHGVMSVVEAALRSAHGEEAVEGLSSYDLTDEVAGTHRGMRIAIPEDEWAVSRGLTAAALGRILLGLAAGVRRSSSRKQVRGPRRPPPKRESGAKVKHVSTAKRPGERKEST